MRWPPSPTGLDGEVVAGQFGAVSAIHHADERVLYLAKGLAAAFSFVDRHREEDVGDGGHGSRGVRVDGDFGEQAAVADAHCAARVEAEPAEPENQAADEGGRHVVAGDSLHLAVGTVLTDTGAKNIGARHSGPTTDGVYYGTASEVPEAGVCEPTGAPYPVAGDRVHDHGHQGAERDKREVLDAFGNGTRHDRRGGSGEHELEEELGPERNTGPGDRSIWASVVRDGRAIILNRCFRGSSGGNPTDHP